MELRSTKSLTFYIFRRLSRRNVLFIFLNVCNLDMICSLRYWFVRNLFRWLILVLPYYSWGVFIDLWSPSRFYFFWGFPSFGLNFFMIVFRYFFQRPFYFPFTWLICIVFYTNELLLIILFVLGVAHICIIYTCFLFLEYKLSFHDFQIYSSSVYYIASILLV